MGSLRGVSSLTSSLLLLLILWRKKNPHDLLEVVFLLS